MAVHVNHIASGILKDFRRFLSTYTIKLYDDPVLRVLKMENALSDDECEQIVNWPTSSERMNTLIDIIAPRLKTRVFEKFLDCVQDIMHLPELHEAMRQEYAYRWAPASV